MAPSSDGPHGMIFFYLTHKEGFPSASRQPVLSNLSIAFPPGLYLSDESLRSPRPTEEETLPLPLKQFSSLFPDKQTELILLKLSLPFTSFELPLSIILVSNSWCSWQTTYNEARPLGWKEHTRATEGTGAGKASWRMWPQLSYEGNCPGPGSWPGHEEGGWVHFQPQEEVCQKIRGGRVPAVSKRTL